jgi:hypothetical protein
MNNSLDKPPSSDHDHVDNKPKENDHDPSNFESMDERVAIVTSTGVHVFDHPNATIPFGFILSTLYIYIYIYIYSLFYL